MQIPWTLLWILIYFVVVMAVFFGCFLWRLKRRPTKHPLGEDIRLMRQPGEHLRLKMESFFEGFFWRVGVIIIAPYAAFGVSLWLLSLVIPNGGWGWVALIAVPALLTFGMLLRWMFKFMDGMMNQRLGWFGERAVADQLECLKQKGYHIFHDVPCIGGGGPFNLDHVVVGRGIVVVVETKTLRKPKDVKDGHKVSYNGQVLIWPSGATSTRELEQAERNADWLRKELKKQLNVETVVHAALTFPGWWVNGAPPHAPVLVVGYKGLAGFIEQRFKPRLTETDTAAVLRLLRKQCSDLDYEALA